MNDREQEFPDELISAYLDGELSPAEKVRVEEQLMDSAEHRRLFEELKALRRSLQALPAESLGDDFAARVLRRAERELLAEAAPQEKTFSAAEEPRLRQASPKSERGVRRGLMWSIIATAAAVGFVVFGPLFSDRQRDLARAPATQAAPTSENEVAVQRDRPATATAKAGSEVQPQPAESVAPELSASPELEGGKSLAAGDSPLNGEAASELERKLSDRPRGGGSNQFAADKDRGADAEVRAMIAEKSAAENAVNGPRGFARAGNGIDQGRGQVFGGAGGASPFAMRATAGPEALATSPAAMAVVSLDVDRASLRGKFFDEVLTRHGIAVEEADRTAAPLEVAALDEIAEAAQEGRALDEAERDSAVEETDNKNLANADAQQAAAQEDVEVVYVVASQSQIESLLHDLEGQSGRVLAMAYDGVALSQKEQADDVEKRQRQVRDFAKDKEEQRLRDEAKPSVKVDARDNAQDELAQVNAVQAKSAAPQEPARAPSPALAELKSAEDAVLPADQPLAEQQNERAAAAKPGYARRLLLPLPSVTKAEAARQSGEFYRGARSDGRLELQAESIADGEAGAPSAALVAPSAALAEASPAVEAAEALRGQLDAAPPAAPLADDAASFSGETVKAKEQQLVRVLFVLRAVGEREPAAAETSPSKSAPEPTP